MSQKPEHGSGNPVAGDAVPAADGNVVIVGLGNDIIADDAIGVLAARRLRDLVGDEVAVREMSWGGFGILDELAGCDWAILIDAIQTGQEAPGTVTQWVVPERCPSTRMVSFHDMGFFTALEFGRMMGMKMPHRITLFTVEAEDVETVTDRMTPAVAASLEPLVEQVIDCLVRSGVHGSTRETATLVGAHI